MKLVDLATGPDWIVWIVFVIFAVLDRRVGKRRLKIMKETIMDESDTFQEFYAIRVKAEGLL